MAMTPEQKRKEEERRKRIAEEREKSGGFLEREEEPLTQKENRLTRRRQLNEFEQETHKARREGTEAPLMTGGKISFPEKERKQREEQLKKENIIVAEETGVFEERPERVELDVTEEERKAKPSTFKRFFGGDTSDVMRNTIFGLAKEEGYKIDDLIQDPETLRATMLQEIQRAELDKSVSVSLKLGSILEPYLGDLKIFDIDIGGYVDKWIRMPTKEVDIIVEKIAEVESSVSGMTDSASQGEIGNPAEVMRDIAGKEETLAAYEARIKKLILESDELKANPEQINLIEEKILSARETFFEAKQRAGEGALITPSDSQLYLKLKKIREENKKGVEK